MNYSEYHYSKKEWIKYVTEYIALMTAVAYLFYQDIRIMIFGIPFCIFWLKYKKRELIKKRKEVLCLQFKDCLHSVAGALNAGYSMENAWKEAQKDMVQIYGKQSYIWKELQHINVRMDLNEPMEQILSDFAFRSELEDIDNFCQVFLFAKRSGGNFVKIIHKTVYRISDKAEIKHEIEAAMSSKKLEQKIMNMVPLFILLYVQLTSPDFLNGLYGNTFGVLVMTGCLLVYIGAAFLAKRIMEIEV